MPDLTKLIEKYVEEISKHNLNRNFVPLDDFLESMQLVHRRRSSLLEAVIHKYNIHRWMYDEDSLRHIFLKAGFREIEKKSYREGKTPDLEFLDNRPLESLYMEGYK